MFKVLLVGDASVGKSSLATRYTKGSFEEGILATIGIDYVNKIVERDGKRVRLQVWDTAGQERFQSLAHSFYRGCDAVLVLYDVTARDTFAHVQRWMRDVQMHSKNDSIVSVLVGNKTDLGGGREVGTAEAAALARAKGLGLAETSAKTGDGVDALFETVADLLYERHKRAAGGELRSAGLARPAGAGAGAPVLGAGAGREKKCCSS